MQLTRTIFSTTLTSRTREVLMRWSQHRTAQRTATLVTAAALHFMFCACAACGLCSADCSSLVGSSMRLLLVLLPDTLQELKFLVIVRCVLTMRRMRAKPYCQTTQQDSFKIYSWRTRSTSFKKYILYLLFETCIMILYIYVRLCIIGEETIESVL